MDNEIVESVIKRLKKSQPISDNNIYVEHDPILNRDMIYIQTTDRAFVCAIISIQKKEEISVRAALSDAFIKEPILQPYFIQATDGDNCVTYMRSDNKMYTAIGNYIPTLHPDFISHGQTYSRQNGISCIDVFSEVCLKNLNGDIDDQNK
ncbi:hypothetical protein ACHJH3_06735 [Campylobacter sp. MOP7]|uniref:hypothetical protein n=1 Tax=Campylobacter canis TaxID=3378588 RepID=UPI00387E5FBF